MNFFSNKSQIGNIDNTLICIETHKSVFWVFNYLMEMQSLISALAGGACHLLTTDFSASAFEEKRK